MKPETQLWLDDAEYDLESAWTMLEGGRYFFVAFMCHLTIEKLLKAVIVERHGIEPPRIHGLISLAQRGGTAFPAEHQQIVNELDDMGVVTRYPAGRRAIAGILTPQRTTSIYERTVKFSNWLRQELNS